MPLVVYANARAPRERVFLCGLGCFVSGAPRDVDADALRAVLGDADSDGVFERNRMFRLVPDAACEADASPPAEEADDTPPAPAAQEGDD